MYATLRALGFTGEPGVWERGGRLSMLVGRRGPITDDDFNREADRETEPAHTYRVVYEPLSADRTSAYPKSDFWVLRVVPFDPSWKLRTFPV